MGKLILSSSDFGNPQSRKVILENLPEPIGVCRVLFIPNEKATEEKIHSGKYHDRLENLGFARENITVFNSRTPERYRALQIDVIYVSGGNTFLTMQMIRETGFDRAVEKYIKNGAVYIGGSAGAHIVTADLTHVRDFDDPCGVTDMRGLGLYQGILFCHMTPEREIFAERARTAGKYKVTVLTDEESVVTEV